MIDVVIENKCLDVREWKGAVGETLGLIIYKSFSDDSKLDSFIADLIA